MNLLYLLEFLSNLQKKYNDYFDNANGTTPTMNYNLFTLDEMVTRSGSEYDNVSLSGAAIAVIVNWDCNLDLSPEKCQPEFSFVRLDKPSSGIGYNFRYANYYYLPNPEDQTEFIEHRDLMKVYGIRFVFLVSGRGGKFDIVPLVINIGSGLALLGVAVLICDTVTLYILPNKKFYYQAKFEQVELHNQIINNAEDKEVPPKRPPSRELQAPGGESSPLLDKMKF